MNNRFKILIVEDQAFEAILKAFNNHKLLPMLPNALGKMASEKESYHYWDVNNFNENYDKHRKDFISKYLLPDDDLITILTAGNHKRALEAFTQADGKIDIAIIDVDLSEDIEVRTPNDHFGGFFVYKELARYLFNRGLLNTCLFIMYTRSPEVLNAMSHLLFTDKDEYSLLSKISAPMIVGFGTTSKTEQNVHEALSSFLESRDNLLFELMAKHFDAKSYKIVRYESKCKDNADRILKALIQKFDDEQWSTLRGISFGGHRFEYLYPIDIGKIDLATTAEEKNKLLEALRQKIFRSFRYRFKELIDYLNKFNHQIPVDSECEKFADILDYHSNIAPYWIGLQNVLTGSYPVYKAWYDSVYRKQSYDYSLRDLCDNESITYAEAPPDLFNELTSDVPAYRYYCWSPDFVQILKVINANAVNRGWGKRTVGKKAAFIKFGTENAGDVCFDFMTDDVAMDKTDIESAIKKCGQSYPDSSANRSEELPELIRTVCDYYDGRVELISGNGFLSTKIVIVNRSNVSQLTEPNTFIGTMYRVVFPKGGNL